MRGRAEALPVAGRVARAAATGAACGAAAGALTALADFGAQWLWLDRWLDRSWFLLRLLATEAPVGALLGAVLSAVLAACAGPIGRVAQRGGVDVTLARRREDALRALVLGILAAPALGSIAVLLFGGGRMSQVPGRAAWQLATALVLFAGCVCALFLAQRLLAYAHRDRRRALYVAAALGASAVGLGKVDQTVLPNLYAYLHGVLTATCWALYVAACLAIAPTLPRMQVPPRLTLAVRATALVLLALAATWNVETIDANQNVRVAMLAPRAAHAASLMRAIGPWILEPRQRLSQEAARARIKRNRATSPRRAALGDGPVLNDAHILLVTIDALRADHLGSYGYARPTSPELDQLAGAAILFERAYTQAPHSSYALSSLLTSEYLHETLGLGHPAPDATLATELASAGYHTAAFYTDGIFHTEAERLTAYEKNSFGFALSDHAHREAEATTSRVLEEIARARSLGEANSLFWVHYFDVHEPYEATTFGTSDLDRYDGEIRRVDAAVARLVREARRLLSRPVIVVVTADHGEEFREHGGVYHGSTLYEEQVRVPLWIDVPGLAPRRIATPIESVDVTPTLLALVGLAPAPSMRGDDLRPLLTGHTTQHDPVFSAVIHKKMVVRGPHKLIADLRFGLFELYDLVRDPHERNNLADAQPDLLRSLTDDIYAWLDSLSPADARAHDPRQAALDRGRLGDRRATEPLSRILVDDAAPEDARVEAARILGRLADPAATASLVRTLRSGDVWVAAEAAIALGRMYDERARDRLRALIASEDADLRARAAVSLGRLRDANAVPGLIDALWIAPDSYEREEAVRWLGRLRDGRALEPLIALLPELRTRYLVVVAMGLLGDPRAYDPLVDVLRWETHANVRDNVVRGLGLLGDPRAIDVILPMATTEPTLKNLTESLVRLDALRARAIGGADVAAGSPGTRGFVDCHAAPPLHDWDFLHRTYCVTRGSAASLRIEVPESVRKAPAGAVVVLGARRTDHADAATLRVSLGKSELEPVHVDGTWEEYRWDIDPATLGKGVLRAEIRGDTPDARFALDHLLLLPRASEHVALARSE